MLGFEVHLKTIEHNHQWTPMDCKDNPFIFEGLMVIQEKKVSLHSNIEAESAHELLGENEIT